jgi:outer membrane protein TolC
MEVITAYSDAMSTIADLRSTSRLMKAASDSDKATRRKYDNGAASILEILNSQKLLAESSIERIQAINAWEVAQIQLINSSGNLSLLNVQSRLTQTMK